MFHIKPKLNDVPSLNFEKGNDFYLMHYNSNKKIDNVKNITK